MRLRGILVSIAMLALATACSAVPAAVSSPASSSTTTTTTTISVSSGHDDSGHPALPRSAETSAGPAVVLGSQSVPDDPPPEPTVLSLGKREVPPDEAVGGLATTRPTWLGTRVLEDRGDGYGVVLPTPPELAGRAFAPSTRLGPGGDRFEATSGPVPDEVVGRSTWSEDCPVTLVELSYLTLTHRGFDGAGHLGEMIVHASVADDVIGVFGSLFDAGFPIEEMRVISRDDLDDPPTGDGNITTSFVCRPAVGSTSWSQHAYGLAIDVNPFQNPYRKGELVLPELASHYLDRTLGLPGMITDDGPVVAAFDAIGWGWGGRWSTLDDYHHFSANGR